MVADAPAPPGTRRATTDAEAALGSAETALRAGDAGGARRALAGIDVATLPDAVILRRQTLLARVLLAERRPQDAVAALGLLDAVTEAPAAQRASGLLVRAQARAQSGDRAGAIRDRALAHAHLGADDAAHNVAGLLDLLASVPPAALRAELAGSGGGVYGSWLELGLALHAPPAARAQQLALWRTRYPNHPALAAVEPSAGLAASPAPGLTQQPGFAGPVSGPVAVLLPLTGALEGVSAAVQDGLLGAHFDLRGRGFALRFYDTAAGTVAAYETALAQGAQAVIGPLRKEDAAALARRGTLPVPTLALNAPDEGAGARHLYVLSLDPLDEIRAAQQRAWDAGARRAAVLYPGDAWGERLMVMMRDAWRARGGIVTAVHSYAPRGRDHGPVVAALLGVEEGARRHRELVRLLGAALAYQPGPRQDLDVVLLAATAEQARLVQPQLRYHGAARVPVYTTAQVWEGGVPALNRDLDGIAFCDAPLAFGETGSAQRGPSARLQALGADAYLALRHLPELVAGRTFAGASGTLHAQANGHIGRELPCARFEDGVPRPLGAPPALAGGS
jgi:uncharacterized protein